MSDAQQKRWEDPEAHQIASEAQQKRFKNPDACLGNSIRQLEYHRQIHEIVAQQNVSYKEAKQIYRNVKIVFDVSSVTSVKRM